MEVYLFTVNCIVKTKITIKRPGIAHLLQLMMTSAFRPFERKFWRQKRRSPVSYFPINHFVVVLVAAIATAKKYQKSYFSTNSVFCRNVWPNREKWSELLATGFKVKKYSHLLLLFCRTNWIDRFFYLPSNGIRSTIDQMPLHVDWP